MKYVGHDGRDRKIGVNVGHSSSRPLDGILVLDFSQFLAGPVAALRLADLGARVIKIERPVTGDIGRTLAFAGREIDGETVSFHAMNRNKQSFAANLKDPDDLAAVKELVAQADVLIQNFRPGVMERIGLDYASVERLNPGIVYGSVTGYGETGPWKDRPGQDLLAQSISGLPWLTGSRGDGPNPVGLSIADHLASCHLALGISAALVRKFRTGEGAHVQTSLLESMLDLQFELLSTHLNDPTVTVERKGEHSAHAFLPAPYGTYPTADGYLSLAMGSVSEIGRIVGSDEIAAFEDPESWWSEQVRIESLLADHLAGQTTAHWLELLDAADVWCAPVLTLEELVAHDGFAAIDMVQELAYVSRDGEPTGISTTRSPIRLDGEVLRSEAPAPRVGEQTEEIRRELLQRGSASEQNGSVS